MRLYLDPEFACFLPQGNDINEHLQKTETCKSWCKLLVWISAQAREGAHRRGLCLNKAPATPSPHSLTATRVPGSRKHKEFDPNDRHVKQSKIWFIGSATSRPTWHRSNSGIKTKPSSDHSNRVVYTNLVHLIVMTYFTLLPWTSITRPTESSPRNLSSHTLLLNFVWELFKNFIPVVVL